MWLVKMEVAVQTARLYPPEKVIGRASEALRLLMEAGLTFEGLQVVIDDPSARQRIAKYWMARGTSPTSSQVKAEKILGKNYISPGEVAGALGITFHSAQLKNLERIPYPLNVLEECKGTHVLIPGYPLKLRDLRIRIPRTVFDWKNSIDVDDSERRSVELQWYLFEKKSRQFTRNLPVGDQQGQLKQDERYPEACEVAYLAAIMELVRNERLFEEVFITTRNSGACFGGGTNWGFAMTIGRESSTGPLTNKLEHYQHFVESGLAAVKTFVK